MDAVNFFTQLFTDPASWYSAHQLLVAQIGINALLALSMFVTLYSGQLSLAQPGFMAIGAYTAVILDVDYFSVSSSSFLVDNSLVLSIVCGTLLAGVAGFVIGLPVLRLRGVFLAIATIGFVEALRFGVILNVPLTGQGQGLKNPDADPLNGTLPIWIVLVVVTYVVWRLTRAKMGRAWVALREDELAAASQGINRAGYKMSAFVIGALIAGLAGGLESHINFFVDPSSYSTTRAVQILTFAIVGGIATVIGPIVGAAIITSLPEIFLGIAKYKDVISGLILIVIIIFRPQGVVAAGRLAVIRPRWWPPSLAAFRRTPKRERPAETSQA